MYLKKIYVNIKGGLGNQLFQYAYARILTEKYGGKLFLIRNFKINPINTHRQLRLHEMGLNFFILNSVFSRMLFYLKFPFFVQHIKEKNDFVYQNINLKKKIILLTGYWQSYKYYVDYRSYLFKEIYGKYEFNLTYQKYFAKININKSVAMHIRRGDYVTNKAANSFHGVLDLNYYHLAVDYFNAKFDHLSFYIFSDDIDWCKINFKSGNFIFIDEKYSNEIQEMKLMSIFKYFIIANSSFSWWPAFLSNYHDKIVICPKKWTLKNINTTDLLPDEWIKL